MSLDKWLVSIALKKALKRGVVGLVAWVMTLGLGKYGVTIDPALLTVGIFSGLEVARNYLKHNFKPLSWL